MSIIDIFKLHVLSNQPTVQNSKFIQLTIIYDKIKQQIFIFEKLELVNICLETD